MKRGMNRLRSQGGFTLVELLVSIMVLVLLVVAMGTGMTTALRVYQESVFQSNSENLASMLNATLEDMFQYSKNIYVRDEDTNTFKGNTEITVDGVPEGVNVLFSNSEYGATNAYIFVNDNSTDEDANPVQFINVSNSKVKDVLNIGAYPNLGVKDLIITYTNGVFNIEYTIYSTKDANSELKVKDAVSMLNQ
jgi:prepilin-type N-terminal cleavage/methylation domain-containing protein